MPAPAPVTRIRRPDNGRSTELFIRLGTPETAHDRVVTQLPAVMNNIIGSPTGYWRLGRQIAIGCSNGVHTGELAGRDVSWMIAHIDAVGRISVQLRGGQQ